MIGPERISVPGSRLRCSTSGCCDRIAERHLVVVANGDFDAAHPLPAKDIHAVQRIRTWKENGNEENTRAEQAIIEANLGGWISELRVGLASRGFDAVVGTPSRSDLSRRMFESMKDLGAQAFAPNELFKKSSDSKREDCPGERRKKIRLQRPCWRTVLGWFKLDSMQKWKRVLVIDDSLHDGRTTWAMIEGLRRAGAEPEVTLACLLWVRSMDY